MLNLAAGGPTMPPGEERAFAMIDDTTDIALRRLVLANQYRILALLDSDNRDRWEGAIKAVTEGWPLDGLPDIEMMREHLKDALTRQDQQFVLDAFNVFELIQDGIKAGYQPKRDLAHIKFPGFDGNSEAKLLSYARHVVENEHRFVYVERVTHNFNAHMPTVELYQRMISAWERNGRAYRVTPQLFDALIEAQIHPSRLSGT